MSFEDGHHQNELDRVYICIDTHRHTQTHTHTHTHTHMWLYAWTATSESLTISLNEGAEQDWNDMWLHVHTPT